MNEKNAKNRAADAIAADRAEIAADQTPTTDATTTDKQPQGAAVAGAAKGIPHKATALGTIRKMLRVAEMKPSDVAKHIAAEYKAAADSFTGVGMSPAIGKAVKKAMDANVARLEAYAKLVEEVETDEPANASEAADEPANS